MTALRWQDQAPHTEQIPISKMLPLIETAIARSPDRFDLKAQLAKALFGAGQIEDLLTQFRTTARDDRAPADMLLTLGRAAVLGRDYELALTALRAAEERGAATTGYLAEALFRLGRHDEALRAGLAALDHSADDHSLLVVARVLFDRGAVTQLWSLCQRLYDRGARRGWLPVVMASCAAMLGRDDLPYAIDRGRDFSAARSDAPEETNRELADELLTQRSTPKQTATSSSRIRNDRLDLAAGKPPRSIAARASRSGRRTRIERLECFGGPLAHSLLEQIRGAVETYVAARAPGDPLLALQPERSFLRAWGLVLRDDKWQDWHVHQAAWISGVYYVQVPDTGSASDRPGAIEFGPFPFVDDAGIRRLRWHVTPVPGLLLLFPAYYAHRTWPTGVGTPRISVAFDVRPSGAIEAN